MKEKAIIEENEILKKQIAELYIILRNNKFYKINEEYGLCDNIYFAIEQLKNENKNIKEENMALLLENQNLKNNLCYKIYIKFKRIFKSEKK